MLRPCCRGIPREGDRRDCLAHAENELSVCLCREVRHQSSDMTAICPSSDMYSFAAAALSWEDLDSSQRFSVGGSGNQKVFPKWFAVKSITICLFYIVTSQPLFGMPAPVLTRSSRCCGVFFVFIFAFTIMAHRHRHHHRQRQVNKTKSQVVWIMWWCSAPNSINSQAPPSRHMYKNGFKWFSLFFFFLNDDNNGKYLEQFFLPKEKTGNLNVAQCPEFQQSCRRFLILGYSLLWFKGTDTSTFFLFLIIVYSL